MSPTIITGKIVGYSGVATLPDGTQGYTTSSVTYTVKASIPSLTMPVEFTGQRPEIRLWPQDQLINVDALLNKTCIGVMIGNDVRWHFFEPPMVAGCSDAPALLMTEEERIREQEIQVFGIAGGGGASGGTPTSGPGGVE
jgi:hypothetical protein